MGIKAKAYKIIPIPVRAKKKINNNAMSSDCLPFRCCFQTSSPPHSKHAIIMQSHRRRHS